MATLPDSTRIAKGTKVGKHGRSPGRFAGWPAAARRRAVRCNSGLSPDQLHLATNDADETSHCLRSAKRSSALAKPSNRTQALPGEERIRVSGVWLILSPRYA